MQLPLDSVQLQFLTTKMRGAIAACHAVCSFRAKTVFKVTGTGDATRTSAAPSYDDRVNRSIFGSLT
jgi:hypothetical protein